MSLSMPNVNCAQAYFFAKHFVIANGYGPEIDWQQAVRFELLSEQEFLREAAWVVLCSGMREAIVRKRFAKISMAFCQWESAARIVDRRAWCIREAAAVFNNARKLNSIAAIADHVHQRTFAAVKERIAQQGTDYLRTLPFIGPITSFHLAKNVGLQVAKPDRHLLRVSKALGFQSVQGLCEHLSFQTGDPVPVVDLVIWRYATLRPDYVESLQQTATLQSTSHLTRHPPH